MDKYFYTDGKQQYGPFTVEEIQSKDLSSDTLMWKEGLQDWIKAKDFPEFQNSVSASPPPIPIPKQTISLDKKASRKFIVPKWLLIWSVFNLAALLLSYSDIGFFNKEACMGRHGQHDADKFWPFTVLEFESKDPGVGSRGLCGSTDEKYFGYYISYNGLFFNYDITDFALYVGGAFFIFILVRVTKQEEKIST